MPYAVAVLAIGVLWGALSIRWIRELHVFSLTPFSSIGFFVGFLGVALILHGFRRPLARFVSYEKLMLILHLLYFVFFFPKPVHALLFTFYFYLIYYLFTYTSQRLHQGAALMLVLVPMLVARSTSEVQFIGLSYITFRAFHMIMDAAYLPKMSLTRHFSFLLYVPSLLAGPIDRRQNFDAQMQRGWELLSIEKFTEGWRLVLLGACMKFVFAEVVRSFFLSGRFKGVAYLLSEFYGYSAYLYLDFAGYSAMAIGSGLMLGYRLPDNFNKPFLSQNPQDFWRRFHISLGEWLRDYFFKPIYKQIHSLKVLATHPLLKQNIALFLTFFLMGCWNGLKWHYLLSGSLFGIYSVVYNSYVFRSKQQGATDLISRSKNWRYLSIFVTVNLCCLALYVFSGRQGLLR